MTTATEVTHTIGLVGNLVSDPIINYSAAGKPWMRGRLSVKPYVPGAETQPEPEYFDLVAFGSLAENAICELAKGSRVVVSGRLEEDNWTGRDGVERTGHKIIADALGPDLRFTGTPTTRTTPASKPPATGITALVGPPQDKGYSVEAF